MENDVEVVQCSFNETYLVWLPCVFGAVLPCKILYAAVPAPKLASA